jgi:hypothetical protein
MKSIMVTYPGYQNLPRGLKMLLVASESFFFGYPRPGSGKTPGGKVTAGAGSAPGKGIGFSDRLLPLGTVWRN